MTPKVEVYGLGLMYWGVLFTFIFMMVAVCKCLDYVGTQLKRIADSLEKKDRKG